MEKFYALINPFTFKIVQFSTLKDEDFTVTNVESIPNGPPQITTGKAICKEIPSVDYTLLDKTYDPGLDQFV
jgi:hypothetical protein